MFVSHCFPFTGHEFGGKPQLLGYLSLNVFEDLGRPDADANLLKAALVTRIDEIIRQRGLKQVEAAKLLGLSQPDVSRLLRGSFREYSMERLLRFLTVLGVTWRSSPGVPITAGRQSQHRGIRTAQNG